MLGWHYFGNGDERKWREGMCRTVKMNDMWVRKIRNRMKNEKKWKKSEEKYEKRVVFWNINKNFLLAF